jgi:hypothetical protein
MSFTKCLLALAALPFLLGGCGTPSGAGTPGASPSATPGPAGSPWIVTVQGSAMPSPAASGVPYRAALPPVSFLPVDQSCAQNWRIDMVLIPLQVTPGKGSLRMTWPRQFNSNYRITAVPQPLRKGSQPAYTWHNIAPAGGCTVSGTITGLISGTPYIVWLDAPNTGYERDGTRHPYSGRSGVVYPL